MNFSIEPFIESVRKQELNVEGIIVWQDGQFLSHHQFVPEVRRNQFSVTKSWLSCGIGIAIEEGLLSLEDRPVDYFPESMPEHINENLAELRLKDLLCMAPGQDQSYLMGDNVPESDFLGYSFSQPFPKKPGTFFWYNNMAPYVAGMMLQKKAGCDLVDYLMPRLFTPLGMARPKWHTDPEGHTFGSSGLEIRLSELFRFIEMYYNYGKVGSRQIVSRDWVELSTGKRIDNAHYDDLTDNHYGYGYYFWRGQHDSFRADGYHAKFGIILRDLNAIVCINSDERRQQTVLDTIWDTVYPQLSANR